MIEAIYDWLLTFWAQLSDRYDVVWDTLDILVVWALVYGLMLLIKGTRAAQMTLGLLILVLAWILSAQLELATLGFLLDNFLQWGVLIVIVIFQGDIRRALTRVGRGFLAPAPQQEALTLEEIVRASQSLAQRRIGALILLERDIALEEFMELGTRLDARLTRDLLIAIFLPYSPLHDGAVIVRQNRIASAGCILPLALRSNIPSTLGTRHRAALGACEESDAIAVVVSEESGKVSLVAGDQITEGLDASGLRQGLLRLTGIVRDDEERAVELPEDTVTLPQRTH